MELINVAKYTKNGNNQDDRTLFHNFLFSCIPALVAILCYSNNIDGEFVHDDIFAIKENPDVTGTSSIWNILVDDFWGKSMWCESSHKSYRPITTLTFRLNYLYDRDPRSFHRVNNALHATVTFLLTILCHSTLRLSHPSVLLAGLIFAVHPVHTEAVTGIVGRADLLAALFFLLSFIIYRYCVGGCERCSEFPITNRPAAFLTVLFLACVSTLCKEHGITVLGVIAIFDIVCICRTGISRYIRYRTIDKNCLPLIHRLACILIQILILLAFRIWIMGGTLPEFLEQDNPASFCPSMLTRFLTLSYLPVLNMKLLLAPMTLCYDWQVGSIPLVTEIFNICNIWSLCLYIGLLVLMLITLKLYINTGGGKQSVTVIMGLSFMVLPFLPASNMFFRVGFVLAERILYIPSMGFCILIAYGANVLHKKWLNLGVLVKSFSLLLIAVFAIKTWNRNYDWYSRESLFKSGLRTVPNNAKIHYNYANFLKDNKNFSAAVHHYKTAIRLYPKDASYYNNLGTITQNKSEADNYYRKALSVQPSHPGAHFNLGNSLFLEGKITEGIGLIKRAMKLQPNYADAQLAIADMLSKVGRDEEAEEYLKEVVKSNPDFADGYFQYGLYLHKKGNIDEALEYYKQAMSHNARHKSAIINTVRGLKGLGKIQEAQNYVERLLFMNRDAETLDETGMFYYETGEMDMSLKLFKEIENKATNDTKIMSHYATVLTKAGQMDKAETIFLKNAEENPRNIQVLSEVANFYGITGKHENGLMFINKAIKIMNEEKSDDEQLALAYNQKGNHYKDLRNYEKAKESYEMSIQYQWRTENCHLNLGVIYHMNGNIAKAKYHYKSALEINPNNNITLENIQKVERIENKEKRKSTSHNSGDHP